MRVMAFAPMVAALMDGSKTVTRRRPRGVASRLAPGDRVRAVDRLLHLEKGVHPRTVGVLVVEEVGPAPPMTDEEARLEGFGAAIAESVYRRMFPLLDRHGEALTRVRFSVLSLAAPELPRLARGASGPDRAFLERLAEDAMLPRAPGPRSRPRPPIDLLLPVHQHREACARLGLPPIALWRPTRGERRDAQTLLDLEEGP